MFSQQGTHPSLSPDPSSTTISGETSSSQTVPGSPVADDSYHLPTATDLIYKLSMLAKANSAFQQQIHDGIARLASSSHDDGLMIDPGFLRTVIRDHIRQTTGMASTMWRFNENEPLQPNQNSLTGLSRELEESEDGGSPPGGAHLNVS